MSKDKWGLLENIAQKSGCMYLSDLHDKSNLLFVQHEIVRIAPEQYSLKEWNEAVGYITQQELSFETRKQAIDYLLTRKV